MLPVLGIGMKTVIFIFFKSLASRDYARLTVFVGEYHILTESSLTTKQIFIRLLKSDI